MEKLDFTFKKNRKLGELISDYIALFKMIFKHFNKNIITLSLPFAAIFMLLMFYSFSYFVPFIYNSNEPSLGSIIGIAVSFSFLMFFFILIISVFGIEYMLLLEEKGNTDFTTGDVFAKIKQNFGKYLLFFLSSILIMLMISIPFGIAAFILAFIPLVGTIAIGILGAMLMLFIYCSLFLYLQGKEKLWDSYSASFNLIKSKIFEYGVASYLFQFMVNITLGFISLIPIVILAIIAFTTLGFNPDFFLTFGGKIIVSLGISIVTLLMVFASIYLISFYVLQYFSLLEVSYSEETLEDIEQIGTTTDEI